MRQTAPDPRVLTHLVEQLTYRPGWTFRLEDIDRGQGSEGLTLIVRVVTQDSYHHDQQRAVLHYMPVPPASYQRRDWQRWLLDQLVLIETHEACEFFTIEGSKPYAPNHGPGRNPYTVTAIGTAEDAATSFRGDVKPQGGD